MNDVVETIAIILAVAMVGGTIYSYVAFMRYIARKETEILAQYDQENGG